MVGQQIRQNGSGVGRVMQFVCLDRQEQGTANVGSIAGRIVQPAGLCDGCRKVGGLSLLLLTDHQQTGNQDSDEQGGDPGDQ